MTWGEQLAAARRARGFTQEELAERLGVSRQAVAKWERDAARPGPANAHALRDLLGEDFPAPPAPSPASPTPEPASPAPAADTPAAPPAKPKCPHRWLAAAGGLSLLFCLLSHFNYLLAAGLGVWLLGLTAAGVVFGAVSLTARGQPWQNVRPMLALGIRAAGAVLAALAVSALFAWGVWVGRAQYRVTALEPLDPALLAACPALSASIGATLPPGETEVLVYGGPVPADEGVTAQYLLVARGLSGPPAVRPQPARYRFALTWQPGGDEMQAWLLELRGGRDFALEQRIAGQQEPIGLVPAAPDSQTQTAWQTELAELWAAVRP